MGLTIETKGWSLDLSYSAFDRFRTRIAYLASEAFGQHYDSLSNAMFLCDSERREFFKAFDEQTRVFVLEGIVSAEVVNFCMQSDLEGELDLRQVEHVLALMEASSDSDDKIYGYMGRPNPTTWGELKDLFRDSLKTEQPVRWW